jgi:hypothetical protein
VDFQLHEARSNHASHPVAHGVQHRRSHFPQSPLCSRLQAPPRHTSRRFLAQARPRRIPRGRLWIGTSRATADVSRSHQRELPLPPRVHTKSSGPQVVSAAAFGHSGHSSSHLTSPGCLYSIARRHHRLSFSKSGIWLRSDTPATCPCHFDLARRAVRQASKSPSELADPATSEGGVDSPGAGQWRVDLLKYAAWNAGLRHGGLEWLRLALSMGNLSKHQGLGNKRAQHKSLAIGLGRLSR